MYSSKEAKAQKNLRSYVLWSWVLFAAVAMFWIANLGLKIYVVNLVSVSDKLWYAFSAVISVSGAAFYSIKGTLEYVELLFKKAHSS